VKVSLGSILLSLKPPVAVLSSQYLDSHCSCCFGNAPSGGLKRCTQCRTVRYCNSVRLFLAPKIVNLIFLRHAKARIGVCTNVNVRPYGNGQRQHLPIERSLARRPDARHACCGKGASKDLKVSGYAVHISSTGLVSFDRKKSREVEKMQSRPSLSKSSILSLSHKATDRSSLPHSLYEAYVHVAHTLVRYLGMTSPEQHEEFGLLSARDLVDFLSRVRPAPQSS
jgi:hypothetical protein